MILRSLKKSEKWIQRRVELHRDLNILWTDPNPSESREQKKDHKAAGHTAGKSTFCRLIRYALGEKRLGSQTFTDKILANKVLREGWVVLCVEVDDEPWIVGRSLTDTAQTFAKQTGDLKALLETDIVTDRGYEVFLENLNAKFVDTLERQNFPGNNHAIQWRDLLPWYTRDQETRLLSLTTWRGPIGRSDQNTNDTDEKHFLMRLVLGIISDEEIIAQDKHEKLGAEKKTLAPKKPPLNAKAEQAALLLKEWIKEAPSEMAAGLLIHSAGEECENKKIELQKLDEQFADKESFEKAKERVELALAQFTKDKTELSSDTKEVKRPTKDIADNESDKIQQAQKIDLLWRQPPPHTCGVPIEQACEKGKLFQKQQPTPIDMASLLSGFTTRANKLAVELAEVEGQASALDVPRKVSEKEWRMAYKALCEIEEKLAKTLDRYLALKSETTVWTRIVSTAETAIGAYEKNETDLASTVAGINAAKDEQEARRTEKNPVLSKFNELYTHILEHLLGDKVEGAVKFSGRSLEVIAKNDDNTDLDSGTSTAAKLIAFDLAILAWSMEGHGAHPRFLIHDSPREADMTNDIYDGLELERAFPKGIEPNFQYIVTTTAPPPDDYKKSPWLLNPALNVLIEDKRILGVNL